MSNGRKNLKNVYLSGLFAVAFVFGAVFGISATAQAQPKATDWSGPYVGINVGAARNSDTGLVECINGAGIQNGNGCLVQTYGKVNATGGVAGVQAGYNWQFNRFVVGPELDFDTSTITGNVTFGGPIVCINAGVLPGTFHAMETIGWIGTARIRAGYAFSPKALVYLTGGYARANGNAQSTVQYATNQYVANMNFQQSGTVSGIGGQWKLDDRKAIRFELLDYTLKKFTTNAGSTPFATTFQDGKDFIFHVWALRAGVDVKI